MTIRRLFSRFLSGRFKPGEPRIYGVADHPIRRNQVSRGALEVTRKLHDAGFKAFVVGGAVRDLLLGIKPKDFDIATHARAEGNEFIVDGIDDPTRLPTYQPESKSDTISGAHSANRDAAIAAGIGTVIDRLKLELSVVEKTGFISYFLIVGDFIRYGRSRGIYCF